MEFCHKPKCPSVCSNPESLALLPHCIFVRKASIDMRRNTRHHYDACHLWEHPATVCLCIFFSQFLSWPPLQWEPCPCCLTTQGLSLQCSSERSQVHGLSPPSYSLFSGRRFYLQSLPLSVPSRPPPRWAQTLSEFWGCYSWWANWEVRQECERLSSTAVDFIWILSWTQIRNSILCVHIWIHSIHTGKLFLRLCPWVREEACVPLRHRWPSDESGRRLQFMPHGHESSVCWWCNSDRKTGLDRPQPSPATWQHGLGSARHLELP